jgi:hypothetical protein
VGVYSLSLPFWGFRFLAFLFARGRGGSAEGVQFRLFSFFFLREGA